MTYRVTTEGADIFYTASPEEPPARDVSGSWEKSTPQGNQIGFVLNVQGKTTATNSSCEILLDGKTLSKKNGTGKVMCDAARP
ncbi:hypothetical protein [Arthrobacter russicus]|uniref:Uncharacterized protein n=1 Tax=Arthrobacter russicus TaxID=172040 RepID=A0ABU1JDZ1_9MICC|nr:hypothetical protein [Arthrobacter russicus]MDR6270657.1 hypothetical protein [Arthrobacter russicus]